MSSNDHANSKRRTSEGALSHKAVQWTELAHLQREREMEIYGDGEFDVSRRDGDGDGDEHDERWRGRWRGVMMVVG